MPRPKNPPTHCVTCGVVITSKCYKGRKYCSNKCQGKSRIASRAASASEAGCAPDGSKSETLRAMLSHLRGYFCSLCGLSEWCGKAIVLIVDHINGNHTDLRLENLRLICPNCDSQTPTFKGRNRGNGRHARRERYRTGKSY